MSINTIEQSEWDERWKTLLSTSTKIQNGNLQWSPRPGMNDPKELFELYNDRFTQFESNMSCGSCQKRVFNRIIQRMKD